MGMEFVAGIDGGGTKTRVCCGTLDGNDLGTEIFGAFNMNGIGREKFVRLLDEITAYLNGMGICRALCIGSAGISNEVMAAEVAAAMDRAGAAPEHTAMLGDKLLTDMLAANRAQVLALMVEPVGGAMTLWQKVLHALQAPFKALCREDHRGEA